MSAQLKEVDARARLAGTNKLEILLFKFEKLGSDAKHGTFGINVFKVREVIRVPQITRAPDMPPAVEGMASLRGMLVPVIDLKSSPDTCTEVPTPGEPKDSLFGFAFM